MTSTSAPAAAARDVCTAHRRRRHDGARDVFAFDVRDRQRPLAGGSREHVTVRNDDPDNIRRRSDDNRASWRPFCQSVIITRLYICVEREHWRELVSRGRGHVTRTTNGVPSRGCATRPSWRSGHMWRHRADTSSSCCERTFLAAPEVLPRSHTDHVTKLVIER
ncbi:hypothetical protein LSH36_447g05023 [Paralvinella palmiformis]|uniref:Uncharacterized protein n=1 Tax=Paralvinella palmiformis TaxID=53620 RepID=A0AAD9JAL6_9ANNE|nr:hypothetical protein LSH36_447g05023 [Paralvinella palmiformis]